MLVGACVASSLAAAQTQDVVPDVVFVPSCEPIVRVLYDSYGSPDDETRERSIAWLRERAIPTSFRVLFRATNDPTHAVRSEAFLGLAEIAPEYQLDAFQMRNLEPNERAELIRLASSHGLIDGVSLRSIATDSSASASEKAQAMLELARQGLPVSAETWIPLLGAQDEKPKLLAALAVLAAKHRTRPIALAQAHATTQLRQSVGDASKGRIATVIGTLQLARQAPTPPLTDWANALINACHDHQSPEQRLVRREAIRTLLIAAPTHPGLEQHWRHTIDAARDNPDKVLALACWAFEAACLRADQQVRTPGWLARSVREAETGHNTGHDTLLGLLADGLETMAAGQPCNPDLMVRIIASGGASTREQAFGMIADLPAAARVSALVTLLQSAQAIGLEPKLARAAARDLSALDPLTAQIQLIHAHHRRDAAAAVPLVLAGVWASDAAGDTELRLMRSLWLAECETEGARSHDRARLADELALVVNEASGFDLPIRAEAAWLAAVLRDQTSEAMARLPRHQNSAPSGERADSLMQWAQTRYP